MKMEKLVTVASYMCRLSENPILCGRRPVNATVMVHHLEMREDAEQMLHNT